MRIAFNRQLRRSPWGGGSQFLTVFADYLDAAGHEVVHSLVPGIDVIVMLDPRHEDGGFDVSAIEAYKKKNPRAKVLHRVNDTGKTRGGLELDRLIINANRKVADHTVYISQWVQDYFSSAVMQTTSDRLEQLNRLAEWRARPATVITNGCDSKVFYPSDRVKENCLSAMSRPRHLVTHHWSDNPSKGLDLYAHIDEILENGGSFYSFTYIGRFPSSYKPKSERFRILPPLYGKELANELRRYDIYVTAARWEACGMHHVEAAACGLPIIFHKDGGGVVEMCSRYGRQIDDVKEFTEALYDVEMEFGKYCAAAVSADLTADTMCKRYLDVIWDMVTP